MKNKLKEYLNKLYVELVMKNRLDGWHVKWLHKKVKETEQKIKECD
tara:strand:+ start:2280 stop:2417 length:138 start_codon:yes stop_codon:yes gene_type:complete